MKKNRKKVGFMAAMVILLCLPFFSPAFAQEEAEETEDPFTITVRNNMIEFIPKGIEIGGVLEEDSSGYVHLLRESGIKYKISPQTYIDKESIIVTEMPIIDNVIGDRQYVAYNTLVPFEFDVIFYTNYDEFTTFPLGTPMYGEDEDLLLGILYSCTNVVANAKQDNGYEAGSYDTKGIVIVKNLDTFWKGYKTNNHVKDRAVGDDITHGDENQENRRTTKSSVATGSYTAYAPYGKGVRDSYVEARNQIMARNDPISMTPIFTMTINPRGIVSTGTIDEGGDLDRQLENIWYELSSVEPLVDTSTVGFVEGTDIVRALPNFNINTDDAEIGGSEGDVSSRIIKGKNYFTQMQSKIDVSIQEDGTIGKGGKYAVPTSLNVIDPVSGENLKVLKTDLSTSLQNKSQWDVRFENLGLQPQIVLYKSVVDLYYSEYFNDARGDDECFIRNSNEAQFTCLGGWQIRNTFVHQRYRAWIEIVSEFSTKIQQPIDADKQSTLDEDETNERSSFVTWDSDNFDETIGDTATDRSIFQEWGDNLSDWYQGVKDGWSNFWDGILGEGAVPWVNLVIIIAVVAVGIWIVSLVIQSGIKKGGGGGYVDYDKIIRKIDDVERKVDVSGEKGSRQAVSAIRDELKNMEMQQRQQIARQQIASQQAQPTSITVKQTILPQQLQQPQYVREPTQPQVQRLPQQPIEKKSIPQQPQEGEQRYRI